MQLKAAVVQREGTHLGIQTSQTGARSKTMVGNATVAVAEAATTPTLPSGLPGTIRSHVAPIAAIIVAIDASTRPRPALESAAVMESLLQSRKKF